MSAITNLYGMYPLGSGQPLPTNVGEEYFLPPIFGIEYLSTDTDAIPEKHQPVAVVSLPLERDSVLAFWND